MATAHLFRNQYRELELSSTTMYVGGKPVLVYSYSPHTGLRSVFQYQNYFQKNSAETESSPYLNACSFFDACTQSRSASVLERFLSPLMKFLSSRTLKVLDSKLSSLASSRFDWDKIHMLNAANAVHLVFIDYMNTDGEHLVHPSVHLYERVLSPADLVRISTEQLSRLSVDLGVRHSVTA